VAQQPENKLETKDLANFYGVTRQSVEKWTADKRKQKTIQALANAEQPICDLIADINKLAYIYDCQWLHGVEQLKRCHVSRHPSHFAIGLFEKGEPHPVIEILVWMEDLSVIDQLQSIKAKLEELVYGLQK